MYEKFQIFSKNVRDLDMLNLSERNEYVLIKKILLHRKSKKVMITKK